MSNKLFMVVDSNGKGMMSTDYEKYIPYENLDTMARVGFKFKVNGKVVAKSNIKTAVAAALAQGVGIPASTPHQGDSIEEKPYVPSSEPVVKSTAVSEPVSIAPNVVHRNVADNTEPVKLVAYSKQVRCVNTGKIYKNQSEAARDLKIDPAQVSDSIKTGRPRSGYTFEKVPLSEVE